jgi:hypothetical protein
MDFLRERPRLETMSANLKHFDFSRASQTIVTSLVEGTV